MIETRLGLSIVVDVTTGYIDASALCQSLGRNVDDYLSDVTTLLHLDAAREIMRAETGDAAVTPILIHSGEAPPVLVPPHLTHVASSIVMNECRGGGGIFIHPYCFPRIAEWLDPRIGVRVGGMIWKSSECLRQIAVLEQALQDAFADQVAQQGRQRHTEALRLDADESYRFAEEHQQSSSMDAYSLQWDDITEVIPSEAAIRYNELVTAEITLEQMKARTLRVESRVRRCGRERLRQLLLLKNAVADPFPQLQPAAAQ